MSLPKEINMYRGLQAVDYSSRAIAFISWDIIITMGQEIDRIWKRPWTNLKTLYFFLRWYNLAVQITILCTVSHCPTMVAFQTMSSQVLMLAVQVLLVMRVRALYFQNRPLRWVLPILLAMEMVIMAVAFWISLPEITYGPDCLVLHFPWLLVASVLPPVLFESLLFGLTIAKFCQALREGWGHEPVISLLVRDGIWVFTLPFAALIINICCLALLDGPHSAVAVTWSIAIPGFAGYRLILNMSHLLDSNRRRNIGTLSSSGGVDLTQLSLSHERTLETAIEMTNFT